MTGIPPAEHISKEDALAKRLKSLREGREEAVTLASGDPPPPYSETAGGTPSPNAFSQRLKPSSPPAKKIKIASSPAPRLDEAHEHDQRDRDEDRTLEEILDALVLEDDQWSVSEDGADESASKRVEELLANLGKKAAAEGPPSDHEMEQDVRKNDGEDDDSEGEEMTRQADDVLARTMDELKVEGDTQPSNPGTVVVDSSAVDTNTEDTELALPAVPHTPTKDQNLPDLPAPPNNGAELTLPTVPTILQDPVPASKAPDDPFEFSIAARLAALKGPEHKPITTDAFGLPSVPTFQPEDRPVPKVAKRPGYSDEDMKTWCVVCLEDATVRCAGCDGDVYCARCWREMHVGPSAGYDERGHAWEKFDPRKI